MRLRHLAMSLLFLMKLAYYKAMKNVLTLDEVYCLRGEILFHINKFCSVYLWIWSKISCDTASNKLRVFDVCVNHYINLSHKIVMMSDIRI